MEKYKIDRFLIQPVIGVFDENGDKIDERTQEQPTVIFGMKQLKEYPETITKAVEDLNENE